MCVWPYGAPPETDQGSRHVPHLCGPACGEDCARYSKLHNAVRTRPIKNNHIHYTPRYQPTSLCKLLQISSLSRIFLLAPSSPLLAYSALSPAYFSCHVSVLCLFLAMTFSADYTSGFQRHLPRASLCTATRRRRRLAWSWSPYIASLLVRGLVCYFDWTRSADSSIILP